MQLWLPSSATANPIISRYRRGRRGYVANSGSAKFGDHLVIAGGLAIPGGSFTEGLEAFPMGMYGSCEYRNDERFLWLTLVSGVAATIPFCREPERFIAILLIAQRLSWRAGSSQVASIGLKDGQVAGHARRWENSVNIGVEAGWGELMSPFRFRQHPIIETRPMR